MLIRRLSLRLFSLTGLFAWLAAAGTLLGCRPTDRDPDIIQYRGGNQPSNPELRANNQEARATPTIRRVRPRDSFVDLIEDISGSVVHLRAVAGAARAKSRTGTSLGSGFVLRVAKTPESRPRTVIVTSTQVLGRRNRAAVHRRDGEQLTVSLVGQDNEADLAILSSDVAQLEELPPLEIGDPDAMRIGEWVIAVGNPAGDEVTASAGIVSARGLWPSTSGLRGTSRFDGRMRTDAVIDEYNTGGPLINTAGQVIAMNTAMRGHPRLGAAVDIDRVLSLVRRIGDTEVATTARPYLGIKVREVDDGRAAKLGLQAGSGAIVTWVATPGPAAGILRRGDIIVEIADRPVDHQSAPSVIGVNRPGDAIPIVFLRAGDRKTERLVLAEMPD